MHRHLVNIRFLCRRTVKVVPHRQNSIKCQVEDRIDRAEVSFALCIVHVSTTNPLKAEDPGESRDTILLPILEHQTIQGMTSIVGNYQHERNDNLDEYFKAVGVPYIPRKMMSMSHPQLQISNDGDKWTIRTISMIRTVELTFTLGEEYEEYMAAGVTLKNVTTMEGDSLVTVSVGPDNNKVVRKYETTEDGVLLTMTHEKSGQVAKRYFTRLS